MKEITQCELHILYINITNYDVAFVKEKKAEFLVQFDYMKDLLLTFVC